MGQTGETFAGRARTNASRTWICDCDALAGRSVVEESCSSSSIPRQRLIDTQPCSILPRGRSTRCERTVARTPATLRVRAKRAGPIIAPVVLRRPCKRVSRRRPSQQLRERSAQPLHTRLETLSLTGDAEEPTRQRALSTGQRIRSCLTRDAWRMAPRGQDRCLRNMTRSRVL